MLGEATKNRVLEDLAALVKNKSAEIIAASKKDIELAANIDATLLDRLKVDDKKITGMVAAIREVISKEDPEGKTVFSYHHPNGMLVENKTVPFGRILIIYESRPDVTIEAAITAFKAGNKIFLKGGKESKNTNLFLVALWHEALAKNNVSGEYLTYLDVQRDELQKLLKENSLSLDLIIPRGGEELINYVKNNTSIPVIISGRGNNFVYVHSDADFEKAIAIVLNGKSRLSVCNATDKVLFNNHIPALKEKVERLLHKLNEINIEVYGDGEFLTATKGIKPMLQDSMYSEEFLAPKILLGTVESVEDAIKKINTYSGGHSATIVSTDNVTAEKFQYEVDSAAVYHNASTRFTDGGELGLGAEIAISTQKLHFRGPVGLGQLVTNKWFVKGNGQIR